MSEEHDPIRDMLGWQGESLAPPPGQFDRVRRRARARRWRHTVAPVVALVVVASGTAAAVVSRSSGGHERVTPIAPVTESPSPSPSLSATPSPTPSDTPTPSQTSSTRIDAYDWTPYPADAVGKSFDDSVSCPAATFCAASVRGAQPDQQHPGPAGLVVYDGTSWSSPTWVSAFDRPASGTTYEFRTPQVACPSTAFCMAVAPNLAYVHWDGSRWSSADQLSQTADIYQMSGLACATDAFCMVVSADTASASNSRGSAYEIWDGHAWSPLRTLSGVSLEAVSCPAVGFCIAFGVEATTQLTMTWSDGSWSTPQTLSAGEGEDIGGIPSLSCPTTRFCMVVGGSHASGDTYATWDGSNWSPVHRRDTGLSSLGFGTVSCPAESLCIAADSGSGANGSPETFKGPLVSVWRDGAWRSDYQETVNRSATLSCPSVTRCVAVGVVGNSPGYLVGSPR